MLRFSSIRIVRLRLASQADLTRSIYWNTRDSTDQQTQTQGLFHSQPGVEEQAAGPVEAGRGTFDGAVRRDVICPDQCADIGKDADRVAASGDVEFIVKRVAEKLPEKPQAEDMEKPKNGFRRYPWAELIQRVWNVDPQECPKCGDRMRRCRTLKGEKVGTRARLPGSSSCWSRGGGDILEVSLTVRAWARSPKKA